MILYKQEVINKLAEKTGLYKKDVRAVLLALNELVYEEMDADNTRAVFVHFRKQKAQKRSTEAGSDISLDSMDMNISNHSTMETASNLEYREMVKQIENGLTEEQKKIFSDKVEGYSLKKIADNHGIKQKRVYKQFDKVKRIVTEVMEA